MNKSKLKIAGHENNTPDMMTHNHFLRCAMLQLDMFTDYERYTTKLELEEVKAIAVATRTTSEKVRKGTYANINELRKLCMDLANRVEIMERNICQK